MKLRITTIIENNPDEKQQLYYEHGLSLLIEADEKRILFDTGQSGNFIKNAETLNLHLENIDAVLISHGHYDHSGGFQKLVEGENSIPRLIVGKEFFQQKYKTISENEFKYIGNSFDEEYLNRNRIPIKKVDEDIVYLTEHILIFHHFHKSNDFEKRSGKFFIKDKYSYIPDKFDDEIALGIITDQGLFVIVGCSHIGIVNILHTISDRVQMPIYAVLGGTHLVDADEIRIQKTINELRNMGIQLIAVSHCTGEEGLRCISQEFKDKFFYNNTGKVIEL